MFGTSFISLTAKRAGFLGCFLELIGYISDKLTTIQVTSSKNLFCCASLETQPISPLRYDFYNIMVVQVDIVYNNVRYLGRRCYSAAIRYNKADQK